MNLREIVRRGRLKLGLSGRKLAESIGVCHSYISQIERGAIRRPSPAVLKKLAEVLPDVHYWELLELCEHAQAGEVQPPARNSEAGTYLGSHKIELLVAELKQVTRDLLRGRIELDRAADEEYRRVPCFTTIPASFGLTAGSTVLEYDEFETIKIHESKLNYDPAAFALRVKGDSMVEAGILEGDIVVVSPNTQYGNGDICVVRVNGNEHSLKRVLSYGDTIVLQPCNSKYDPVVIDASKQDELFVYGKVVHVERSLK